MTGLLKRWWAVAAVGLLIVAAVALTPSGRSGTVVVVAWSGWISAASAVVVLVGFGYNFGYARALQRSAASFDAAAAEYRKATIELLEAMRR